MTDGMTEYTPRVNCITCGRFVGKDGSLNYEYFEMSSEIASLDGECRRCIDEANRLVPLVLVAARDHAQRDWITHLNVLNVIENRGHGRPSYRDLENACHDSRVRSVVETKLEGQYRWFRWKGDA